jgi:cytochrome c-type biogenesis protein CcmH
VHAQSGPELQELAARLAARLLKSPDDLQGWEMLGRSYTALGRFDEATAAYAHAAAGPNPGASLLADYADALAAANGGKFDATAERLVARALQSDPHEPKALSLAGTIAYDQGDYPLAIQHWTLLATRLP